MDSIVEGHRRFKAEDFPHERATYEDLARNGQKPVALMISCSDSRVVPEIVTRSGPGTLFVTRNAGNIVPPFSDTADGGVTSAIEYAVVGLGVRHVVVCGHADCGAMKALLNPAALETMPTVKRWLSHCRCSIDVFHRKHGADYAGEDAARRLAEENVAAQLLHLRTHPCVAAALAAGELTLHGWIFDIETGTLSALDGETGAFMPLDSANAFPIALAPSKSGSAPHLNTAA